MSESLPTDPVLVVAQTLWGEARGQGTVGLLGVACVIRNRVRSPRWWGTDWQTVCLKPWQFSCWNESDPNRAKILAADAQALTPAIAVARAIISVPEVPDIVEGADSYYDTSIPTPSWAVGLQPRAAFAGFKFFRTVP